VSYVHFEELDSGSLMRVHSVCTIKIIRSSKPFFDSKFKKAMSEHDKNRDKKVVKRILAILCNSQQLSEPEKDGCIDPESPQNVPQKMELQKGNEEYFEMLRAELDKLVRTLSKEDKMDLLQGWCLFVLKDEIS